MTWQRLGDRPEEDGWHAGWEAGYKVGHFDGAHRHAMQADSWPEPSKTVTPTVAAEVVAPEPLPSLVRRVADQLGRVSLGSLDWLHPEVVARVASLAMQAREMADELADEWAEQRKSDLAQAAADLASIADLADQERIDR